jgi:hypothetical protein
MPASTFQKGDRVVLKESYENVEGQIILVLKDHMYKGGNSLRLTIPPSLRLWADQVITARTIAGAIQGLDRVVPGDRPAPPFSALPWRTRFPG